MSYIKRYNQEKMTEKKKMYCIEQCKERIKTNDFAFGDDLIVNFFGKKFAEKLKKNNPVAYCSMRDDPTFMLSGAMWND